MSDNDFYFIQILHWNELELRKRFAKQYQQFLTLIRNF